MINTFAIIDNFYENPHEVRAKALSMEYFDNKHSYKFPNGGGLWPGRVSKSNYVPKNIDIIVSKLLGIPVRSETQESGASGYFRMSQENDQADQFCHVDSIPKNGQKTYSGILYMNTPEQSVNVDGSAKVGTRFYSHKVTGRNKVENNKEFMETHLDFNDPSKWTPDVFISLRWNRLVIVDNSIYHGYGDLFGNSIETARCAQLFLFNTV